MSAPTPRRRKSAVPPSGRYVKASILVDVELHARWAAAAALRSMDRSAFAVEAIREACKGIVLVDRRKSNGSTVGKDRPVLEAEISSEGEESAA